MAASNLKGVELMPTYSEPSETFWRQLRFQEFDISEMSLSSYLIAESRGTDFVAIPVFPSRRFMHAELSHHVGSGIQHPGDVDYSPERGLIPQKPKFEELFAPATLDL